MLAACAFAASDVLLHCLPHCHDECCPHLLGVVIGLVAIRSFIGIVAPTQLSGKLFDVFINSVAVFTCRYPGCALLLLFVFSENRSRTFSPGWLSP